MCFFIEYRQGPGLSWLAWTSHPLRPIRDPRVAQFVVEHRVLDGVPTDLSIQALHVIHQEVDNGRGTDLLLRPEFHDHGVIYRHGLSRAFRYSATPGSDRVRQRVSPEWKAISAVLRSFESSGCEARAIFWSTP